jgi:MFS transporter, ceroid-lipofuscinosis neuronal protein 7
MYDNAWPHPYGCSGVEPVGLRDDTRCLDRDNVDPLAELVGETTANDARTTLALPLARAMARQVSAWQWQSVMNVSVFLSCLSFAVVMPSIWPYLSFLGASRPFLAWVVAIYSVGEAAGAVVLGSLSTSRSTRGVMLLATVAGCTGAILYIGAPLAPSPNMVLVGRFLQGMWTGGAQAVQQTHLAKVLRVDDLTAATVNLNAAACAGMVFGPAVALVSSCVPSFTIIGRLRFDELTGPGYFVYLSTLIIFVLYTFLFGDNDLADDVRHGSEDTPLLGSSPSATQGTSAGVVPVTNSFDTGMSDGDADHSKAGDSPSSSLKLALAVCNIAFFTHFYGFALQETITTPLVESYYDWSLFSANLLFTAAGVASLGAFFVVGVLSRLQTPPQDRDIVVLSLVTGVLGFCLLISTPQHQLSVPRFLAGFMAISIAFPLGRASVVSLYTKILPLAWQGSGQGAILAVGAVARVLGPFWAVRAFDFRFGGLIVFGATACLFAATLALLSVTYRSLRDTSVESDYVAVKASVP